MNGACAGVMESAAVLYAGLPAGALDLSLEAARDCFTWSEEGFGDVVEQQVLRRLFAADQELLQVGVLAYACELQGQQVLLPMLVRRAC